MADHSSDPTGRPIAAEPGRTPHVETDAATPDAFAIPSPNDAPVDDLAHDSDDAGGVTDRRPRGRRRARTDWRLGGHTVRRWREGLLAVALIGLAVALLVGTLLNTLWASPVSSVVGTVLLWAAFGGVAAYALVRSRPVGLLSFQAVDLLYGLGLAVVLRIVQGWLEIGERGSAPFPTITLVDGRPSLDWWITEAVGAVAIAPVVEEFFFRGVILVTVYSLLRRRFGEVAAGVVSVLASTGLFVVAHALLLTADVSGTVTILLLGLVCASLVVLTGRIWGAVLLHVGFNATYLMLTAVGAALG